MKVWMAPNIPLTIVLFAALAAVVLRAAARRPEPGRVPGTEPAPVRVTAGETQPRPGVAAGSTSFTNCTLGGAMLFARYATASTRQRDAAVERAKLSLKASLARRTRLHRTGW
jgi:hypothetical protein